MPDREQLRYLLLCAGLGVILGWIPYFLHGPIPEKYMILHIDGRTAVWGWYTARMAIGLLVAVVVLPRRWLLRGLLCGFCAMFPLTLVSLATPGCGFVCMKWNLVTGAAVGILVAGIAKAITGRDSLLG